MKFSLTTFKSYQRRVTMKPKSDTPITDKHALDAGEFSGDTLVVSAMLARNMERSCEELIQLVKYLYERLGYSDPNPRAWAQLTERCAKWLVKNPPIDSNESVPTR